MEFVKVSAIIGIEMVETVELALETAGVNGFTMTKAKDASGRANSPPVPGCPRSSR
jgi:hypothetical protein